MSEFRLLRWKPVQLFVYLALRLVATVVDMFPYSSARTLGRAIGGLVLFFDRKHRRIARENLRSAGYAEDRVAAVFANIGTMVVEMLMLPRLVRRGELLRHVRLHVPTLLEALKRGRGAIVTIGHLGNWELAGVAATLSGIPLHALARPIDNPYIHRWLLGTRQITGMTILSKRGAMPAMIDILRRNGILIIQVDQDAKKAGVFVDFLGRPASTVRSPALLSLKYGAPILPGNVYRENGMHHLITDEPLNPDDFRGREDAVRDLTQALTSALERMVREHPDQWNWAHRRWKTKP